jgi:hypothetical protein
MKNLIKDMKSCWQVEDKQSIWDHGISVYEYSIDLINILNGKQSKFNQKVPQWILDHSDFIIKNIVSENELKMYTIFHDCGKPYCKPDT